MSETHITYRPKPEPGDGPDEPLQIFGFEKIEQPDINDREFQIGVILNREPTEYEAQRIDCSYQVMHMKVDRGTQYPEAIQKAQNIISRLNEITAQRRQIKADYETYVQQLDQVFRAGGH